MICSICWENNAGSRTSCNHYFCNICLENWKLRSNNCPLCRQLITGTIGEKIKLKHRYFNFEIEGFLMEVRETTSKYYIVEKTITSPAWLKNNMEYNYLWETLWTIC